ncbi:MAG: bifunctional tetrahydrofolate synthase/dihydrofolate synthase, partial [Halioglobus sp.]|nr:bifunctional tetrahydrofolate synthase/dihydrofolate synthase [Halioglobus sp.]
MSSSELEQWLRRLEQIHPKNIDLGLERVAAVADTLSLRSPRQPVVTVAGTNGKGSVVAVLEAALAQDGRRVGAFTSPHLQRFNERIRVDGQEATDAEIMAAFTAIDRARGETSLTYFEFAALAALWVFRERQVDVLLLEVGLGGRLDAVNIIDASLAVITSIALDHQDWLGDSREVIAVEKAGVLRPGIPVVVADPEPPASLTACIRDAGAAPTLLVGRHFGAQEGTGEWQGWLQRAGVRCDLAPVPDGPLLPQNVCAALQAAVLLGVDVERIDLPALLTHAAPDGRRQFIHCGGLDYLLDVAHNPAAVQKLLEYVELSDCKKRKIAVFSA